MENNRLQDLLQDKLEQMPHKARRVVEFLLTHMREAAFISIGEVAEQLDVSKAQLVRVARMLGFKGYADLKDALKETILEQVNPAARLTRAMSDEENLPNRIRQMEHANLEDTWNRLRPQDLKSFCALVRAASNIYCAGWNISAMMAECFYSRFRELGLAAQHMKPGCLSLVEQVRCVKEGDLMIALDLPGYSVFLTEAVEKARSKGAKVITVTDSPAAPICRFADLSFFVSDNTPTFGNSLISSLFLIHLLSSVLSVDMGEEARSALEDQAQCLQDQRVYYPVFGLRY